MVSHFRAVLKKLKTQLVFLGADFGIYESGPHFRHTNNPGKLFVRTQMGARMGRAQAC